MSLPEQTTTPYSLVPLPNKQSLVEKFRGKPLTALRTPAMVIDRATFADNCAKMHQKAQDWGADFRAHVKTHKSAEGVRLQLQSKTGNTHAVVVSTMAEAWGIVHAGLVKEGTVKDILYGLPVAANKILDLSNLWDNVAEHGAVVRLLIDHPKQVDFLETFEKNCGRNRRWSAFVKIDAGNGRAGVKPLAEAIAPLLEVSLGSNAVSVYGFYCHAGNSYASTSLPEASQFLSLEVEAVNKAAKIAQSTVDRSLKDNANPHQHPFVLSVGSTPTAHAASADSRVKLASLLNGSLELHAGNYAMLDLQQKNTGLIEQSQIAQRVLSTVISYYPGRGSENVDEALCDAGAIAMSKDTGPSGGYGEVVGKAWRLDRISQEHGMLKSIQSSRTEELTIGSQVQIIGQHACLIAAAYPYYYIVDSSAERGSEVVVDIWVPWKGW